MTSLARKNKFCERENNMQRAHKNQHEVYFIGSSIDYKLMRNNNLKDKSLESDITAGHDTDSDEFITVVDCAEESQLCETCGDCFENLEQILQHKSLCSKKMTKCEICKEYIYDNALEKHLAVNTSKDKKFLCEICGLLDFEKCYDFSEHLKSHSNDIMPLCNLCERYFSTELEFKNHLESECFICNLCGLNFNDLYTFNRHVRLHNVIKVCFKCKRKFHEYYTVTRLKGNCSFFLHSMIVCQTCTETHCVCEYETGQCSLRCGNCFHVRERKVESLPESSIEEHILSASQKREPSPDTFQLPYVINSFSLAPCYQTK